MNEYRITAEELAAQAGHTLRMGDILELALSQNPEAKFPLYSHEVLVITMSPNPVTTPVVPQEGETQ